MRNISFALTTEQVRRREKTVTRRLGWTFLKAGDELRAIVKGQGLKKGETVTPLGVIRVVQVHRERLRRMLDDPAYGLLEVKREGFPLMPVGEFVSFFAQSHGCTVNDLVTRIEFSYVEESR